MPPPRPHPPSRTRWETDRGGEDGPPAPDGPLAATYRAYLRTGRDPDRFWGLTPRLCLLELIAHAEAERDRRRAGIRNAWLTAVLGRGDSIPPLDELIDDTPRRPLGLAEAIDTLRDMAAALPRQDWTAWLANPSRT